MECGVPFCQSQHGCPLGNIIPRWNDLVHKNDWYEALKQLLQTNNFPEFTGRVCPAPCEGSCTLGIIDSPVAIKTIEVSIIEYAFEQGWIRSNSPKHRSGKKVAIIGSGPAGLACADQLNKAGHTVFVYERQDRIGGLLQYGIPTMKLSKKVLQRRIDLMTEAGIMFKPSTNVGIDITGQQLLEQYDAICLTTGATWPRDLRISGRELNGIYFAVDYLRSSQQKLWENSFDHPITAKDKNVIVIGGGDTGCDCIGTALRQVCFHLFCVFSIDSSLEFLLIEYRELKMLSHLRYYRNHRKIVLEIIHGHNGLKFIVSIMAMKKLNYDGMMIHVFMKFQVKNLLVMKMVMLAVLIPYVLIGPKTRKAAGL